MTLYTTEEILASLNDGQQQAATLGPGRLLVLVGPGNGKTRTLISRYVLHHIHMLQIMVKSIHRETRLSE